MEAVVVREVVHVSSNAERLPNWVFEDHVPVEELARRQDVKPITSLDDLARPDLFETDVQIHEFLADLYASRRADLA